MLLFNMAEPDWISVHCHEEMLCNVLCVADKDETERKVINSSSIQNKDSFSACSSGEIILETNCYEFHWRKNDVITKNICGMPKAQPIKIAAIPLFERLFDGIFADSSFPLIMIQTSEENMYGIKFERILNKLTFKNISIYFSEVQGFFVCHSRMVYLIVGLNIFCCKAGGYISADYICDGSTDCPNDESDEADCPFHKLKTSENTSNTFRYGHFQRTKTSCPNLYFMTKREFCEKYRGAFNDTNKNKTSTAKNNLEFSFSCNNGKIINANILNDLNLDCGPDGEDEPVLMSLLIDETFLSCVKPNTMPCTAGHSRCFYLGDICVYKLDVFNQLVPCGNGGHLQNCQKFECNKKFKCIVSYCIPWTFVCDGKWDCPEGEDELNNTVCKTGQACIQMLKCKQTTQSCVHFGNVCDGYEDCPLGDDEYFCNLKQVTCFSECKCLLFAISCRQIEPQNIISCVHARYSAVDMTFSNFDSFLILSALLSNAIVVKLSNNHITTICGINVKKIIYFNLETNDIEHLYKQCMKTLIQLQILEIDDNKITCIEVGSFHKLHNLKYLNLSNNPLSYLPENMMSNSVKLKLLFIMNTSLNSIHPDTLYGLSVNVIITDDYRLCCVACNKTTCPAYKPWHISCDNILPRYGMKVFFISMSVAVVLLNILSVASCCFPGQSHKPFLATVLSTNINDVLCGIYLMCIWAGDIAFEGVVFELTWRSSPPCFTAFGIVLFYTIMTQFCLIFLSLSRLMVVIHPITTHFKQLGFVLKSVFLFSIISFLFGLSVTTVLKITEVTLPFNLCLPFVDPTRSVVLIMLTTWFSVISQILSSLLILMLHTTLVYQKYKKEKIIQKHQTDNSTSMAMVIQLVVITASNILCWLPANGIFIAAMFLSTYPVDIIIFTTVAGLPVNAFFNPCVFTFMSVRKFCKSHFGNGQMIFGKKDK